MKINNCQLCGVEKKTEGHHLSYESELIVSLCRTCHRTIHNVGRLTDNQLSTLIKWVHQYKHEWINGEQKYKKSERYRRLSRERAIEQYRKDPEKAQKKVVEWRKKNPLKVKEYNKKRKLSDYQKDKRRVYGREWMRKRRLNAKDNNNLNVSNFM